MERDEWTCRNCCASGEDITLNVHHMYYESGKAPWEYSCETLITLCEDCHKQIAIATKKAAVSIGFQNITESIEHVAELAELIGKTTPKTHPAYSMFWLSESEKNKLGEKIWELVEQENMRAFDAKHKGGA
jgi:O-acetylhomoserine/O-acetylserine sulfhydrylase-like pyridoxal-dependent enzyme